MGLKETVGRQVTPKVRDLAPGLTTGFVREALNRAIDGRFDEPHPVVEARVARAALCELERDRREVDADHGGTQPREGDRITADVALEVAHPLTRDVAELFELERLQLVIDRAVALEVRGLVQRRHLVPPTPVDLDLFVHGRRVPVPAGIGIDARDGFISPIHTHDSSGIVHVESPDVRTFTLGEVFGVWGVRLTRRCLGGYCANGAARLRVYVDGRPFAGDPRVLPAGTDSPELPAIARRAAKRVGVFVADIS